MFWSERLLGESTIIGELVLDGGTWTNSDLASLISVNTKDTRFKIEKPLY